MLTSVLESLFGSTTGKRPNVAGMLLNGARILAWKHRHLTADLEHLVFMLVDMVDVRRALDARGVHADDVIGVARQLMEDLPKRDADSPDLQPGYAARLDTITNAAMVGGVVSTSRFVTTIAEALPAELAFLRRPLASCASELAATFDATTSSKDGALTFEAWEPELKTCMGLMQHFSDKRWEAWQMGPIHLFIALLCYKPHFAYFKGRGQDPRELMLDLDATLPAPDWPQRGRPEGLTPALSASLLALILRAERYAASDATNVRLRHVLLALHDEPELTPWIDRLAG